MPPIQYSLDTERLRNVLLSNRNLQQEIRKELQDIADRKRVNRECVSKLVKTLKVSRVETRRETLPPQEEIVSSFFMESNGNKPEPNQDTKDRDGERSLHTFVAWQDKDSRQLKELTASNQSYSTFDYQQIAATLGKEPEECRLQHERIKSCDRSFTKEQLQQLSEAVRKARERGRLDWEALAGKFPDRTAWECFSTYKTKIAATPLEKWTPDEDELLLKFIALAGPQFALDKTFCRLVLSRILPNKSKKSLIARVNQSLLNPRLLHKEWDMDEERTLVVLMKMYADTPKAESMASIHFDRAMKSVVDKWRRGLNPAYLATPFSKQEDSMLMKITRKMENKVSWTELSEKHFPNRHPQRLMNRWNELATDHDFLQRGGYADEAAPG